MAVAVFARYPRLSPETYDEVVASLDLDANPPAGAILHLVGEGDGALLDLGDLAHRADVPGVPRLPARAGVADARVRELPGGRDHAAAQPVRGRDGDHRADGRSVASRHLRGCGALAAPHPLLSAVSTHVDDVPLDPTGVLDRDHNAQRDAELLSLGRTTGSHGCVLGDGVAESLVERSTVTVFLTSTGRGMVHERRIQPRPVR